MHRARTPKNPKKKKNLRKSIAEALTMKNSPNSREWINHSKTCILNPESEPASVFRSPFASILLSKSLKFIDSLLSILQSEFPKICVKRDNNGRWFSMLILGNAIRSKLVYDSPRFFGRQRRRRWRRGLPSDSLSTGQLTSESISWTHCQQASSSERGKSEKTKLRGWD